MYENGMIIKTRKLSPKEVKKKLRDFIDEISEDCGPEVEQMADELKGYGDQFIDALSGNGDGAQFRNNGEGFRNGGGFSHSSFRGNGGGSQFRNNGGQGGEFRDEAQMRGNGSLQMRDEVDWDKKEKQRQEENRQKMEQLEAEMQRLKMRMRDGY